MTGGKKRHGLFLAVLCLSSLQLAWPAHAYVRAVTELGVPVWWKSPCIDMNIYLGTPPPTMTADQYWNASQLAAQAWSHDEIACTGLSISMTEHAETTADVGLDQKNVIVFRRDTWCAPATVTDAGADTPTCYSHNAMAVTTLFKNKKTGEIIDADMEINAVYFTWADLVADPTQATGATADFQNTLTHELGHVIGLAHNCYIANDGPSPLIDNLGNTELNCGSDVPATVTEATMYPVVPTDDTERRSLSPDDKQAACEIYPSSQGARTSDSGCSVASQAPARSTRGWAIGLALCLVFASVAIARRR